VKEVESGRKDFDKNFILEEITLKFLTTYLNFYRFIYSFLIYLILPAAPVPGVYSASNRNQYQKQKNNLSGGRAQLMRRAESITAIYEPIV
jgi:hypothetical protein